MRRMHGVAVVLVSLVFLVGHAHAAEEAEQFFTFYYTKPAPEKVLAEFGKLDNPATPMDDAAVMPFAAFLAEVFEASPKTAADFLAQPSAFSERGRYTVAVAVCVAGLPEREGHIAALLPGPEMGSLRDKLTQGVFLPLLQMEIRSAGMLDALWGAFMASGNGEYVRRIISVLENPASDLLLRSAARWSLGSNARQHSLVLQICREEVSRPDISAQGREELEEILQKAATAP